MHLISSGLCSVAEAQAIKAKEEFKKFQDSVLSKTAKIQALINDLKKNYDDPVADKFLGKTKPCSFP